VRQNDLFAGREISGQCQKGGGGGTTHNTEIIAHRGNRVVLWKRTAGGKIFAWTKKRIVRVSCRCFTFLLSGQLTLSPNKPQTNRHTQQPQTPPNTKPKNPQTSKPNKKRWCTIQRDKWHLPQVTGKPLAARRTLTSSNYLPL